MSDVEFFHPALVRRAGAEGTRALHQRTTEALAAAKARGVTLGNPKIDEARQKAAAEIVDHADQRAANVIPIMRQIQRSGATSLRQIAEALNARGISAPRGGQWHATSIRNVMARAWLEAMEVGPFELGGALEGRTAALRPLPCWDLEPETRSRRRGAVSMILAATAPRRLPFWRERHR